MALSQPSRSPDRITNFANRLVAGIARHWLLLFNLAWGLYVFTPFLAPVLMAVGLETPARAIYGLYSLLCHQLPDHSYFLFGHSHVPGATDFAAAGIPATTDPLLFRKVIGGGDLGYKVALCQRDVAIYGSVLATGVIYGALRNRIRIRPLSLRMYIILVLPMAVDGLSQMFGLHTSTWWLRSLTGALFGAASVWLAYPYVDAGMRDVVADQTQGDGERSSREGAKVRRISG